MRRKLQDRNIRKITKVAGGSFAVILPIEMVRELKWLEHQKVVVTRRGKTLTIKDWKKKK